MGIECIANALTIVHLLISSTESQTEIDFFLRIVNAAKVSLSVVDS